MVTVTVQRCTIAELAVAPEMPALAMEYTLESQIKGMPAVVNDWEGYKLREKAGMLHSWSATLEGRLIGFISLIVSVHPRYNVPLSATESWFVAKAHRKTGAGLRLFRLAEAKSIELTGRVPLVSAPYDSDTARVLRGLDYREASIIFYKGTFDA